MEINSDIPLVLYFLSPVLPPRSPGALLNPTSIFQSIAANIICSIVFGERFDYKDHQFLHLLDLVYKTSVLMSSLSSQVSWWEERSTQGIENKRMLCG